MSTRSGLASGIRFDRHSQRHLIASAVHGAVAAARAIAPARFKALGDVGEPDTGPLVGGGRELVLAAMLQPVADLEHHSVIVEMACLDADHNRLAALRNAIFDRILDNRLEYERGHARLLEL